MTYKEQIEAIRSKITLFGGTIVSLKNSQTIIGFGRPGRPDGYICCTT